MTAGWFAPNGWPMVKLNVWIPDLGFRLDLVFRIDTSAARSRVSSFALALTSADLPMDDQFVHVDDGQSFVGIERRAIISVPQDEERWSILWLDMLIVDDGPGESRLGRDILNQWLMVYDAPGGNLLLEPVET